MRNEVMDASATTIIAAANKVTWGSAITSFLASFAEIDLIAWLGILIALCGLLVQWYYRSRDSRKSDEAAKRQAIAAKRQAELDELRKEEILAHIEQIKSGISDGDKQD